MKTITAAMASMPPVPTFPAMPKFDFAKSISIDTAAMQTVAKKLQQGAVASGVRGAVAMPSPCAEAAERWRVLSAQFATPAAESAQQWRDLIATIAPPMMPPSFPFATSLAVQTAAAQTVAQKLQQIATRTSELVTADLQREADRFTQALRDLAADQERITATAPATPAAKAAASGRSACPIAARQSQRRDASVRAPRAAHTTPRQRAACRSSGYSAASDAEPSHAVVGRYTDLINHWMWEYVRHEVARWLLVDGIAQIVWMTDFALPLLFVITTTQRIRAWRRRP
jgi:hypothetical protein